MGIILPASSVIQSYSFSFALNAVELPVLEVSPDGPAVPFRRSAGAVHERLGLMSASHIGWSRYLPLIIATVGCGVTRIPAAMIAAPVQGTDQSGEAQQVVQPLTDALVQVLKAVFPYALLLCTFIVILVLIRRASHHEPGIREGTREMLRIITGRAFIIAPGQLLGMTSTTPPIDDSPADPPTPQTQSDNAPIGDDGQQRALSLATRVSR